MADEADGIGEQLLGAFKNLCTPQELEEATGVSEWTRVKERQFGAGPSFVSWNGRVWYLNDRLPPEQQAAVRAVVAKRQIKPIVVEGRAFHPGRAIACAGTPRGKRGQGTWTLPTSPAEGSALPSISSTPAAAPPPAKGDAR